MNQCHQNLLFKHLSLEIVPLDCVANWSDILVILVNVITNTECRPWSLVSDENERWKKVSPTLCCNRVFVLTVTFFLNIFIFLGKQRENSVWVCLPACLRLSELFEEVRLCKFYWGETTGVYTVLSWTKVYLSELTFSVMRWITIYSSLNNYRLSRHHWQE